MKPKIFLFIIFAFFSLQSIGQRYLLMDKYGGGQRREFYPGDEFSFKLEGENHFNKAIISHLSDSLIFFDSGVINIKDISAVYIPVNRGGLRGGASKLKAAGILLLAIDQFNTLVIAKEPFRLHRGVLIAGGSLLALGYILDLTKKSKYKIKGNRRLRIIDVGFG